MKHEENKNLTKKYQSFKSKPLNFKNIIYNNEEQIINFDNFEENDLNKFLVQEKKDFKNDEVDKKPQEISYANVIFTKGIVLNIENLYYFKCSQMKLKSSNIFTKILNVNTKFNNIT